VCDPNSDPDAADARGHGDRCGSAYGERGLTKRLDALATLSSVQGHRLLDFGCGPGSYTTRLAAGFDQVDAVDIEPERLSDFRTSLEGTPLEQKIRVALTEPSRLDFDDATFDVVTAIEVLEHVVELDAVLDEIHRVLRPGGRFLITSPNRWFPFEQHGFHLFGRYHPPAHLPFLTWVPPLHERLAEPRVFTRTALTRLLTTHRFRVEAVTWLMPPFDRSRAGNVVRPLTERAERSPLRVFGSTLVMSASKRP
jgi:SAM-dependent methyltransferase